MFGRARAPAPVAARVRQSQRLFVPAARSNQWGGPRRSAPGGVVQKALVSSEQRPARVIGGTV